MLFRSSARVAVTLIDRANFHLFQPLLYQVATAAISPGDIASPVRQLFRNAFNVRVLLGTVTGIDTHAQLVRIEGNEIPYDHLVLATGATHSYFGKDGWAPYAPGLKRVEDALEIRRQVANVELAAEVDITGRPHAEAEVGVIGPVNLVVPAASAGAGEVRRQLPDDGTFPGVRDGEV